MELEDFKNNIEVLSKLESFALRKKYINHYINTKKEHYRQYIENTKVYADGECYIGYLWDCLLNPIVISEEYVSKCLEYQHEIYLFWDIHSKENIYIENYWKFDKDDMLKMNSKLLMENLVHLPEDIYIFDTSFSWTLSITHEYVNGARWCLKSGAI